MELQGPELLLCLAPPAAALVAFGTIFIRDVLDSPGRRARRIIREAADLDPLKVGKFLKDKAYDKVPQANDALHATNGCLNTLSFGYVGWKAGRELDKATKTALIVKERVERGDVGSQKTFNTIRNIVILTVSTVVGGCTMLNLINQ